MTTLEWLDDRNLRIGSTSFGLEIADRFTSTTDRFLLVKHRTMVERYATLLADLQPKQIIELGICEGGSAAFVALLTDFERFVAFDLKAEPVAALEAFIAEHDLGARLHTYYGFDQADAARMRRTVAEEFGGQPLDLVVDDASHVLAPTRASFNVLFPQLRPGGLFVIEDWAGRHHIEAALGALAERDPAVREKLALAAARGDAPQTPITVMLFELVLATAYAPDVFAEVFVTDDWAYVVRGPGALDPEHFDLSQVYTPQARQLLGRLD